MTARLEKVEKSEAYLEFEVDAATLETGLEKAYRKVVKQVTIPGFRKGKVPREFLEAHFGKEVLYEDALEFVVPEALEQALTELDIEPLAQPELDIGEIKSGQPLNIKVKVAVKPEIVLGQVEGLEVGIPAMKVTEEDVDHRLEEMRNRYAQLVEKSDEPSELGDTLTVDFVGSIDGVPFEGGSSEDYQLELGSHTFIPGFEEQLTGLKLGDVKDVQVTFPAAYHAEDLAGKEAVFKTTVKKVEHRQLRPLDDDFAQEVSDFDTMAELRDDVRSYLEKANDIKMSATKKKEVLAKAVDQCNIDIAPAVAEAQFQNILSQFEQRLAGQGIALDQYFQMTNSNLNEFRQDMFPEAERNAKTNFMLEKIVDEKGFELTDEEVDQYIKEIADQMGVELDQARQNLAGVMDQVRHNMKVEKAVQYLVDHAVITEIEATAADPASQGELVE